MRFIALCLCVLLCAFSVPNLGCITTTDPDTGETRVRPDLPTIIMVIDVFLSYAPEAREQITLLRDELREADEAGDEQTALEKWQEILEVIRQTRDTLGLEELDGELQLNGFELD